MAGIANTRELKQGIEQAVHAPREAQHAIELLAVIFIQTGGIFPDLKCKLMYAVQGFF